MATPDTRNSIVIVKQFTRRGSTQRWSNRYHLNLTSLPTSSEWTNLADAIVLAEKAIYPSYHSIVEAVGYDCSSATSTNPHGLSVFTKTYSTAGTGIFTNAVSVPGDVAAVIRYSTTQRSMKNHPIYLFNYYHGALGDSTTNADVLNPAQVTAYNTYATAWLTGFSDGTHTYVRCGPRGAVAQSRTTLAYLRHRDFPG